MLDDGGDDRGTLDDVDFDDSTGALGLLHVGGQEVAGLELVGVGSYAVVVRVDDPAHSE